jgi:probable F420-dependent oxidoreductase
LRFIYQYPDMTGLDGDMLDSGPVGDLARVAEDAGWDGYSFTEHPAPGVRWLQTGGHQTLDPFVALAYAAAVTSRIKLLTYLSVLPYRNPMLLAKAAASVDIVSGGRFILGAGVGYNKSEFFALGVDFDERNALFDETLDVLPKHWSGEPFSYTGRHFSARDVIARPKPPQQPIPVWLGGNSKLTRRRVAERADGWMPMLGPDWLFTTARTAAMSEGDELAAAIAQLRADAGERGPALDISVAYTDPSVHDPDTDWGRHRDAIAALAAIGVTWVIVPGRAGSRDSCAAFLQRFGKEAAASGG